MTSRYGGHGAWFSPSSIRIFVSTGVDYILLVFCGLWHAALAVSIYVVLCQAKGSGVTLPTHLPGFKLNLVGRRLLYRIGFVGGHGDER